MHNLYFRVAKVNIPCTQTIRRRDSGLLACACARNDHRTHNLYTIVAAIFHFSRSLGTWRSRGRWRLARNEIGLFDTGRSRWTISPGNIGSRQVGFWCVCTLITFIPTTPTLPHCTVHLSPRLSPESRHERIM